MVQLLLEMLEKFKIMFSGRGNLKIREEQNRRKFFGYATCASLMTKRLLTPINARRLLHLTIIIQFISSVSRIVGSMYGLQYEFI